MDILLLLFLLVNFIAFVIIGYDKWLAVKGKRRISEKGLLFWVAVGGTIGSSLGMLLFRHKVSKRSYLLKFFLIVGLQVLVLYAYLNYNEDAQSFLQNFRPNRF